MTPEDLLLLGELRDVRREIYSVAAALARRSFLTDAEADRLSEQADATIAMLGQRLARVAAALNQSASKSRSPT